MRDFAGPTNTFGLLVIYRSSSFPSAERSLSAEDLVESVIGAPSVFRDKSVLYPEYLPQRLPHREKQLRALAQAFKQALVSPGSASQRVVLVGGYGTGKTATARVFGKLLETAASKRGLSLTYVHVNCYKARTFPQVLLTIARELGLSVPQRGLSAQEVLRGILDELDRRKRHAIIALDEFDYFLSVNAGTPSIYSLIRLYDDEPARPKRVHFLMITRSTRALEGLEPAVSTFFLKSVVDFPPYTSRELRDILSDRAALAFHEGTVDEEVIKYVAYLEGIDGEGGGSARTALEILARAGESADSAGRGHVTMDDVRRAHVVVKPELAMLEDTVAALDDHKLLLLLAVVKSLRGSGAPFVRIGDVERLYRALCESYGVRSRRHTQVYTHVMDLRNMHVVQTKSSGKGYRGKSTLVGVSGAPLDLLERRLEELLERRAVGRAERRAPTE